MKFYAWPEFVYKGHKGWLNLPELIRVIVREELEAAGFRWPKQQEPMEPLPGPYKMDPHDGNAYRFDHEGSDNAHVWITDMFGGHDRLISKQEWEGWTEFHNG